MTTNNVEQNFSGVWDAEAITVIVSIVLSIYNGIELLALILFSFKTYHGLYFWSLVIASWGVIPYCIGFLLEYYGLLNYWASMLLSTTGWVCMITGQSFVLYSRLGLILTNPTILKGVKWMIIIDAILFHISTTIVQYVRVYANGDARTNANDALFYIEKIQMTGFCVQEFIISGLYLYKTIQLLNMISRKGTRRVMWELLSINVFIIIADIALLAVEYRHLRALERALKSVIYSIKLKLEFAILGRLIDLVQSSNRTLSNALADVDSFVDPTRTHSNVSRPVPTAEQNEKMPDWMTKLEGGGVSHVEHAHGVFEIK